MHRTTNRTGSTAPRGRRSRRGHVAAATAAALAGMSLAGAVAPAPADAGELRAYLVDARTPGVTAQAAAAVQKAGGRIVQEWPQIGVIVVQSTRTSFLRDLRAQKNSAVVAAADSRNEAVSEGVAAAGSVSVKAVSSRTGTTKRLTGRADTLVTRQTYLRKVGAIAAQRRTEGNSKVLVGVLDSGVDGTHSDLSSNFDAADSVNCTDGGRPDTTRGHWTGTSHGTHTAGVIAAAQQGQGIQGVAPHVSVASVKVITADDATWPEYLVCGFMWAGLKHMNVTNNSYTVYDLWCDQQHLGNASILAVRRAISWATKRGVAHVQAAGNDGLNLNTQVGGSCADPLVNRHDVMQVSAVDDDGTLLAFSNVGLHQVDIAAPGLDIYSTLPRNRYGWDTGTSDAAPQVSGALALLASEHPTATPGQLITGLEARATRTRCGSIDYDCTTSGRFTSFYGAGILNVKAAIVPTSGTATVPLLSRVA